MKGPSVRVGNPARLPEHRGFLLFDLSYPNPFMTLNCLGCVTYYGRKRGRLCCVLFKNFLRQTKYVQKVLIN